MRLHYVKAEWAGVTAEAHLGPGTVLHEVHASALIDFCGGRLRLLVERTWPPIWGRSIHSEGCSMTHVKPQPTQGCTKASEPCCGSEHAGQGVNGQWSLSSHLSPGNAGFIQDWWDNVCGNSPCHCLYCIWTGVNREPSNQHLIC